MTLRKEHGMTIRTDRCWDGCWTAVDDDTYDGPDSPIGIGHTEAEAVNALKEWIWMRRNYKETA